MRRLTFAAFVCLLAFPAAAQTMVQGQLNVDTTWSGTVTMTGDVTVPAGKTLTIQPGTVITAATTDGQASGNSTTAVELIVSGTLAVNGAAGGTVVFQGTGTSTWYGIRALAGATVTATWARFERMTYGFDVGTTATVSNSTFQNNTVGLRVTGGTGNVFANDTFTANGNAVVLSGGTSTLSYAVIHRNTSVAVQLNSGSVTVDRSTISDNSSDAFDLSGTATLTLTSSLVTNNAGYGVDRNSGTANITYSDVWGNGTNYYNTSGGTGTVSINPLYVDRPTANYKITSNSPARLAGSGGVDMGAYPFAGDATVGLQGTLYSNLTLTGSNNVIGDLTVSPGVTLTIAAGATLSFATTDSMGAGNSTTSPELIVRGTLTVNGTAMSPAIFTGVASNTWYGVRILSGSTVTVQNARFERMTYGVDVGATSTISSSTFQNNTVGLRVTGGTNNTFDSDVFTANGNAIVLSGGSSNLSLAIIHRNTSVAVQLNSGSITVDRSTISDNSSDAFDLSGTATLALTSSLVTNNAGYGVDRNSGTASITYSDVWGNGTNYYNTSGGTGTLSIAPLYADRANANYRLTSNSPARQTGVGGVDMGALPYTSDPTVGLQGSLYTNLTLSGSVNVLGDLTVMPGVTLTIQPGTTLNFATTDSMGAGNSTTSPELIIRGSLQVAGSAAMPAVFTGTSGNTWYGVRVLSGATVSVQYARFERMTYGVDVGATSTISDSTFANNTVGLRVTGGTNNTFSNDVFTANGNAIVLSGGSSNLSFAVIHRNTSVAVQLNSGTINVDRSTISDNSSDAFDLSGTATLALTSSLVTNNAGYGVDRNSGTASITYSDVWGNGTNYYNTSGGTGTISTNALYVDRANAAYRLTSNSPARQAGAGGVDMGALPYISDATVGLQGKLFTNLTLTGAVAVLGDVTVAPGVTLSVQPGATLSFATTDSMGAGNSTTSPELIVQGSLQVAGSAASPAVFTGTTGNTWYGVRILAGSTASVTNARFERMTYGVDVGATATISSSLFTNNTVGLRVTGGTGNTFASDVFTANGNAIVLSGGSSNLTFAVIHRNTSVAVQLNSGTLAVDRSTISDNSSDAFDLSGTATLTMTSSIVSSNAGYGVDRNSGTASITYSDVWGNGTNYYNTSGGTGSISSNPNYVAQASADYHLTSTSPCIGTGAGGVDMGAFPYTVGAVDHIVVSPSSTSVSAGGVVGFSATAYDAANNPIPSVTFTWTALAAAGTITQAGVLTASCAAGSVMNAVTATASGRSGSANVTINPGPPATVTVTPAMASIASQATQAFTAVVRDSCMNVLSTPVTWSALTQAGTITPAGVLTAGCTRGTVTDAVTATAMGITGRATVTVGPGALATVTMSPTSATLMANGQQQFNAGAADGCANPLTPAFTWTTTVPGGNVSSSGLFTAGAMPGSYPMGVRVSAMGAMGNVSASADVTVQGGPVATVSITPVMTMLAQGATQQFTAEARDSNGNVVMGQTTTWSVVSGGGTISASGLFTAGTTAGTFMNTVRATVGGVNAQATVVVLPGAVTRVAITPGTVTLAPNGTATFTAQAFDANNNPVSATIAWSAAAAAGAITQGGVFTAGAMAGTYNNAVTASAGGVSASANVTISAGALSQLIVMPGVASVQAGGTVAFLASGRDAAGNPVTVTPTWSIVAGGGTINAMGVFTAGNMSGTFPNTVKLEASGLTAFASVNVTPGPTVFVEVSPNFAQVSAGGTQQFTAQPRDAFGNPVSSMVSWSASAGGSISAAGLFTAGLVDGEYANAISATADGMTGHASVRVVGGVMSDAGTMMPDAGTADAGQEDAGTMEPDAGAMTGDAGAADAGMTRISGNNRGSGCSCQTVDSSLAFALLGAASLLARRRR